MEEILRSPVEVGSLSPLFTSSDRFQLVQDCSHPQYYRIEFIHGGWDEIDSGIIFNLALGYSSKVKK